MAVGLQLAGKNDFVKVQENINNNLTKLDEAIDFNLLATLGIPYGGILNNSNAKISGKAYYDQTGKKLYKCTANTSLNYADASYFTELSNNDLLGKLNNLISTTFDAVNTTQITRFGPNLIRFSISRTFGFDAPSLQPNSVIPLIFTFPFTLKKIHSLVPSSLENSDGARFLVLSANDAGSVSNNIAQLIIFNSSTHAVEVKGLTFVLVVEGEM